MQVVSSYAAPQPPVPHLRLRTEKLLIDIGAGFSDDFREVETAVIDLLFDYGGVRVPASSPPLPGVQRNHDVESYVRRIIEGFGPVDLACLEDCALIPGCHADYAVHLEGDLDVLCAFGSHAIPRLRALGWSVEVDENYPVKVVTAGRWYAELSDDEQESDWFTLELGVEVEGEHVDLLPVILELIETKGSLDALARSSRRFTAIPLGKQRYMSIPPSRLAGIARVVQELYDVEGIRSTDTVRFSEASCDLLEQLEGVFADVDLRWFGEGRARYIEQKTLRKSPPPPVDPPKHLIATLRPYQAEGLAFLQALRRQGAGGILADDMGLGKTLQTIAHITKEKELGHVQFPNLVVAPTSLVGNWAREIGKFAPGLDVAVYHGSRRHTVQEKLSKADVVITTYGVLVRERDLFERHRFHLQVLDEAQTIKNTRSQAHQACKAVDAEYRLCLSGTPVENNLEEMWALFDFVMPGLLGDASSFRTAFRYPIERDGNADRFATLRRRVAPYILRRLKNTVARELPPKTEIVRALELRGEQRDLYESIRLAAHAEVRQAVRKKGVAASTIDILGALMKLRQVCCDPRLVRVSGAQNVEQSSKLRTLMSMVPEMVNQGRQILIFSQFTSMLTLIAQQLEAHQLSFVSLTGATANRQAAVDAFQEGQAKVFLISLKAGGTGLNLTAADTVIHYDPWWNPAAQAQATDRAYRIGQKRPVFVYNLIIAGSVEERMLNLQQTKQALADGLLEGPEQSGFKELSSEDVDDLFAPLS